MFAGTCECVFNLFDLQRLAQWGNYERLLQDPTGTESGMIRPATLLAVDAALEGATGIVLIAVPGLITQLLFASALDGAGVIVARIGGMGLVGLALACWLARGEEAVRSGVAGMLVYNLLAGIYLLIVGLGGVAVGLLLWPAAVVHLVVAALFAAVWHRNPLE